MSKAWPQVPLGEVLTEQKLRIGTSDADDLPLLGVSNQRGLQRSALPRIGDMSRYLRVNRDWFAYNPMRINVGSIGWAEADHQTGVISPDYVVFSCTERVLPRLVFEFLKHRRGLQEINSATAGSVRERLYFESLARIPFPLPPLAEQRRLVARIEELAGQIQEARGLRHRASVETDALLQASASALFSLSTAPMVKVGEIVGKDSLRNGKSVKPADTGEGIQCLSLSAMRGGRIDMTMIKPVPLTCNDAEPYLARRDDVFIVRGNGSKELCGLAGRVEGDAPGVIFPDLFIRVPIPTDQLLPEFFVCVWNSSATRQVIEEKAKTTSGIWKINQGHIISTSIPIPSLVEQRRIVAELDALQERVDALKRLQSETSAELNALLPAILDRAFRGELV